MHDEKELKTEAEAKRVSDERLAEMVKWIEGTHQMLEGMPSIHDGVVDELALDLRDSRATVERLTRERDEEDGLLQRECERHEALMAGVIAERDALAGQVAVLREEVARRMEGCTHYACYRKNDGLAWHHDSCRVGALLASTESVAREYRERIRREALDAAGDVADALGAADSFIARYREALMTLAGTAPMGSERKEATE